jgi:hypothetical protein
VIRPRRAEPQPETFGPARSTLMRMRTRWSRSMTWR